MDARLQKKSNGILLVLILVLFFSCSKDEEFNSPLVGNWNGISYTTSAPVDENMDGTAHTDLKQEMECVSIKASFTSRGNFTITSAEDTYDIDIINGEVILTHTGCSSYEENGTWSLNESNTLLYLEFEIPGNPETTLVEVQIELSENHLVMKNLDYSEDGSITYTVEFERS